MKYLQVYNALRQSIEEGVYSYADKLPSKRVTADKYGVSVITAVHALELLEDEGYVASLERSGYYVIYKAGVTARIPALPEPSEKHRGFIKVEDFPFATFAKTMRRVLTEYGERILERTPGQGSEALRGEISRYLARAKGINAPAERIVIGAGAEYLYTLAVLLLGRDGTFALEDPSYGQIERVYRSHGVTLDMLPLENDGISSEALMQTQAKVLHVSPYRSYPSGAHASATKRAEYIRWVQNGDRYIIEDDFESEFSKNPSQSLYGLAKGKRVIYINTFSKTLSPSMRMAYMVLPGELTKQFERRLGFYSCTVPAFEQFVIAEFIKNGDFERHINKIRRKSKKTIDK